MSNVEKYKQLALPAPVSDITLLSFRIALTEIEKKYGQAHQSSGDNSIEAGPTLYWGIEYACTLKIILAYDLTNGFVYVTADQPEYTHILDHLSLPIQDLWQIAADNELLKHLPSADGKKRYLWRQDENGHREMIQKYDWDREANCRLMRYEKMHHKQIYWLEKGNDS